MEHEPQRTVADYWREGGLETLFGQRVRRLRVGRGWSQEELAERLTQVGLQFHQTQVGKLESGSRPIRLNEAQALALIFDTPLSNLLDDSAPAKSEPFADEIVDLSVKLRSLQQDQVSAQHQVDRAMRVLAYTEEEIESAISRLSSLYRAPVAARPVDDAARKAGLFEIYRSKEDAFTWRLNVEGVALLGGRDNYRTLALALLDVAAVRYMALMVPENKANRVGSVMSTHTSGGRCYLSVSGREGPLAAGPEILQETFAPTLETFRKVAPQAPINIRQVGSTEDGRWFSLAAYLPRAKTTIEYEMEERKSGQYEYACRYDAGRAGSGIARAAGGFHSRHEALRQIKKDCQTLPGPVFEKRGGHRDPVDVEWGLQFTPGGYVSSAPTYGDPVDLSWQ
ncbi:helix-turn-helix domain-containing protein [Nonomuraea sp. NPDC004702]